MKLSIESYVPIRRFGGKEGLKMIKDAGFDCVDYSYYAFKTDSDALGEGYIEYAKELRAHLDEIGLECSQAHAPYIMGYDAAFDLDDVNYKATVHSIESAAILGAESIIVHSIAVPKNMKELSFWKLNQEYYKSLIPFAEKAGILIAVENLYNYDDKRKLPTFIFYVKSRLWCREKHKGQGQNLENRLGDFRPITPNVELSVFLKWILQNFQHLHRNHQICQK